MRLLNVDNLEFEEFRDDESPMYAIASHRWQEEEVTFQEVKAKRITNKKGYQKVRDFAKYIQESVHTVEWLWIDTCCINKDSGSSLYYASCIGLERVVDELLGIGEDVNAHGGLMGNALQVASLRGHEMVVQRLIDAGAHVNAQEGHHVNALLAASIEGYTKVVKLLLDCGAEVTTDYNNMTALHYTAIRGHEDVARVMLNAGISVDLSIKREIQQSTEQNGERLWEVQNDPHLPPSFERPERGLTPLHYAALIGSARMARFFVSSGANPNARSEHGETPLHLAVKEGLHGPSWTRGVRDHWNDPDLRVECLLDSVSPDDEELYRIELANVEAARNDVLDILFCHSWTDFSAEDDSGMTPLHCVPYKKPSCTGVITRLLRKAVSVDQCDSLGRTALHLACLEANVDAIQLLIRHGARICNTDKTGLNCLHYAAYSGDEEAIRIILQSATDAGLSKFAKTKDHQGHNALHCLLGGNLYVDVAAVQRLTAHNVGVDDITDDGDCPLSIYFTSSENWIACSSHKAEIVDHLFRAGANPSFTTANGCLNFGHLAASANEVGVKLLKVLAEYGVNLAAEDHNGRTILHHCALHGSIEEEDTLNFLCDEVGLSNDSHDRSGMTPLALATQEKLEVHHPDLFRSERWIQTENILSSNLSDHRKNT